MTQYPARGRVANGLGGVTACTYKLNTAGIDFTSCPITATTQPTSDNSTKAATTANVKVNIAAVVPVPVTGTPSVGMVPVATSGTAATWQTPAAAGTFTGTTLASGVTASSLLSTAGGTLRPQSFVTTTFTGSFTITTTTGICTFTYSNGVLATKTGSC